MLQALPLIVSVFAVVLSTGAVIVAMRRLRAPAAWRIELAQLDDEVTKLTHLVRKLNSRATMADRRHEEAERDPIGVKQRKNETPQEWKARVREEMRAGKIKLHHHE